MKNNYLILLLIISAGLFSCKKEGTKTAVSGKWFENKLRIYATDSTGKFLYDTTFLQPFTASDYLQFNNNGTCVISTDYYYYPNQNGQQIPPQKITPAASLMNFTAVGTKFVLTSQSTLTNPGGFDIRDTVSTINAQTLVRHTVVNTHVPGYTSYSDAYYTRK